MVLEDEKKSLKRSFQKVQPEEEEEDDDDDYRMNYSPRETDATAPQLVGMRFGAFCCTGGEKMAVN